MSIIQFDSGSYTLPGLPPTLLLEYVNGGSANSSIYIGSNLWAPVIGSVGMPLTLDSTGIPPYPVIVTRGGIITDWGAQFEALSTAGVNPCLMDPLGIYALQPAELHAELLYAPALEASPEFISNISDRLTVIADINLGYIPITDYFTAFHGTQKLVTPFFISPGDYLLVHFYIISKSDVNAAVNGFHMQASVYLN